MIIEVVIETRDRKQAARSRYMPRKSWGIFATVAAVAVGLNASDGFTVAAAALAATAATQINSAIISNLQHSKSHANDHSACISWFASACLIAQ